VAPRLPPLLQRVVRRVAPLAERHAPALALARADLGLGRAWARQRGAVEAALGAATADALGRALVAVAERDPPVARALAAALPDLLARVPLAARGRLLRAVQAVGAELPAAALSVARALPELLPELDDQALAGHLDEALRLWAQSPRRAESFLRRESRAGQAAAAAARPGVGFDEVQRTMSLYARAHCGEDVTVRIGTDRVGAYTDGRHVHLPERVDTFGDRRDHLVYRVLTARSAGYIEFGTLDLRLDGIPGAWPEARPGELEPERMLRGFSNPSLARDLFLLLEGARVEAQVRRTYPGVARDMDEVDAAWRPDPPPLGGRAPAEAAAAGLAHLVLGWTIPDAPPAVVAAAEAAGAALPSLREPGARVEDVVRAMLGVWPAFDGLLRRVQPESLGRRAPRGEPGRPPGAGRGGEEPGSGDVRAATPVDPTEQLPYTPLPRGPLQGDLRMESLPVEEREVEDRARRIAAALGEAPAELRRARARAREELSYEQMAAALDRQVAPGGPVRADAERPEAPAPARAGPGSALAAEAAPTGVVARWPEWDTTIDDHKPDWVQVREYRLEPGGREFIDRVRAQHGPLVAAVRRSFEALRPDAMARERGLVDGDELDVERAVLERVERRAGGPAEGRVYQRRRPRDREVGVAFLVDLSSSTNEVLEGGARRILDVEKEALFVAAEAVSALGDACAIWGWSGYGRQEVAFYVAKELDEPWDDAAQSRVGRMSWKMENRDGAAIRHATARMARWPVRVKLLVLLSDGRPLDCGCDQYADRYAQEDTRAALLEARAKGVRPFCITVDPQGQRYLERMYGEGGFVVIDRVEALPRRLPGLLRRLTR